MYIDVCVHWHEFALPPVLSQGNTSSSVDDCLGENLNPKNRCHHCLWSHTKGCHSCYNLNSNWLCAVCSCNGASPKKASWWGIATKALQPKRRTRNWWYYGWNFFPVHAIVESLRMGVLLTSKGPANCRDGSQGYRKSTRRSTRSGRSENAGRSGNERHACKQHTFWIDGKNWTCTQDPKAIQGQCAIERVPKFNPIYAFTPWNVCMHLGKLQERVEHSDRPKCWPRAKVLAVNAASPPTSWTPNDFYSRLVFAHGATRSAWWWSPYHRHREGLEQSHDKLQLVQSSWPWKHFVHVDVDLGVLWQTEGWRPNHGDFVWILYCTQMVIFSISWREVAINKSPRWGATWLWTIMTLLLFLNMNPFLFEIWYSWASTQKTRFQEPTLKKHNANQLVGTHQAHWKPDAVANGWLGVGKLFCGHWRVTWTILTQCWGHLLILCNVAPVCTADAQGQVSIHGQTIKTQRPGGQQDGTQKVGEIGKVAQGVFYLPFQVHRVGQWPMIGYTSNISASINIYLAVCFLS